MGPRARLPAGAAGRARSSSASSASACPRSTAGPAPTSSRTSSCSRSCRAGDAGVGVTVAVHTSAVTLPILAFGTDEQRARFVPPLARGEKIGAFALTEPEAGSDAALAADGRGAGRRRLDDHRHEAVDHERRLRRHDPALRAHRRGDAGRCRSLRVRPRRRPGRGHARGGEARPQLVVDGRPRLDGRACRPRPPAGRGGQGLRRSRWRRSTAAGSGSRRRRVGHRAGRVRRRPRLRARATPVRQADRRVPGDPVEARGHGDRDRRRPPARPPSRVAEAEPAARTPRRARRRSCSPRPLRAGRPARRSRSSAATATRRSSPSSGTTATRRSPRSTRARARSSAW